MRGSPPGSAAILLSLMPTAKSVGRSYSGYEISSLIPPNRATASNGTTPVTPGPSTLVSQESAFPPRAVEQVDDASIQTLGGSGRGRITVMSRAGRVDTAPCPLPASGRGAAARSGWTARTATPSCDRQDTSLNELDASGCGGRM